MAIKKHIKTVIFTVLAILMFPFASMFGQVVMGGEVPDPSAVLDIQNTDRGLLLPRLSQIQRDAISAPSTGLLVFNSSTLCLEINSGDAVNPDWTKVRCRTGAINSLMCDKMVFSGELVSGQPANNLEVTLPYTNGNGGYFPRQVINSTGLTGLVATLDAGNFLNGDGTLKYKLSGRTSGVGDAVFQIELSGLTCNIVIPVKRKCGAYKANGVWADFMCHNLGVANANADPFTPGWEICGGYWQWGVKNQAAPGPSGPSTKDANEGIINGWSATEAPDDAWRDYSRTVSDPCPSGYRIPSKEEWIEVMNNNTTSRIGTWSASNTNYMAGRFIGPGLLLPAAGLRFYSGGTLINRGITGYYWSSTKLGSDSAWFLASSFNGLSMGVEFRTSGFSVRCISENSAD